MKNIETILFWFTIFGYISVFCLQLFSFITQKTQAIKFSTRLIWIVFLFHTSIGVLHWIGSGHPPVTDIFELNLSGTWFTMLIFLLFDYLKKITPILSLIIIPLTFILMGYGYMSGIELIPLGPAFQSPWLVVHVIFAWLAFGCYAIATGSATFLLWKNSRPDWGLFKSIPGDEQLDITSYRFIILGFINHAIMLISGAIWAKKLWGHYWSWDALETWSLIAFLYYAFYLHLRTFLGWKQKKAAWTAIIGLLVLAISFWGVELFGPSIHPGP